MRYSHSDTFLDDITQNTRASAQPLIGFLYPQLRPSSVLDLGSGRGVWLNEWHRKGVEVLLGVDGDHVNKSSLAIASEEFMTADLTQPLNTGRRFDLAQCLEVGERLPEDVSVALVGSLTAASDRVLFSAAVKGQGGALHVNEQPLSYWQKRFEARGYRAFDCVRPVLRHNRDVAPWHRFNTILYINETGRAGLPDAIKRTELPEGDKIQDGGDLSWLLRRHILSLLPPRVAGKIVQLSAAFSTKSARKSGDGPRQSA